MPYETPNKPLFFAIINCNFFTPMSAHTFARRLHRVDYSVVESRREGHNQLNQFIDGAIRGYTQFDVNTRYPEAAVYFTDYASDFNRILTGLGAVLSYRTDNKAKDVNPGTVTNKPNNSTNDSVQQEVQDNTKRFEELISAYEAYLIHPDNIWFQDTFERRAAATWKVKINKAKKDQMFTNEHGRFVLIDGNLIKLPNEEEDVDEGNEEEE